MITASAGALGIRTASRLWPTQVASKVQAPPSLIAPTQRAAVVVLTSVEGADPNDLAMEILKVLVGSETTPN